MAAVRSNGLALTEPEPSEIAARQFPSSSASMTWPVSGTSLSISARRLRVGASSGAAIRIVSESVCMV